MSLNKSLQTKIWLSSTRYIENKKGPNYPVLCYSDKIKEIVEYF